MPKTTQTDVLRVLYNHASTLIDLQFEAPWELVGQQGPDQDAQATLIQKARDDAVVVLLSPNQAFWDDLQILNGQLSLALYVRPCWISKVQSMGEVSEHGLHLLATIYWGISLRLGIFGQEPFNCISNTLKSMAQIKVKVQTQHLQWVATLCCVSLLPSEPNISQWCFNPKEMSPLLQ